jgi:hypothetical protein
MPKPTATQATKKEEPPDQQEAADITRQQRTTVLECPECNSHRATILETRPPKARCADCSTVYKIKTEKPVGSLAFDDEAKSTRHRRNDAQNVSPAPPIRDRDIGVLTDFINTSLSAGPEGLRDINRKAAAFAQRFGLTYLDTQWFIATPWLIEWAKGNVPPDTNATGNVRGSTWLASPRLLPNGASGNAQSATRLRLRAAISWRARWLAAYAMSGSKALSCRQSNISEHTAAYHLRLDSDFRAQADAAHEHFVDLLHTRAAQRALEGDLEPIHWQGVLVDHVRKFDSRLQIEMLRAHMPNKFKTPGSGNVNIDTGNKILVMSEDLRAKLIAAHREEILSEPVAIEDSSESQSPRVETADTQ